MIRAQGGFKTDICNRNGGAGSSRLIKCRTRLDWCRGSVVIRIRRCNLERKVPCRTLKWRKCALGPEMHWANSHSLFVFTSHRFSSNKKISPSTTRKCEARSGVGPSDTSSKAPAVSQVGRGGGSTLGSITDSAGGQRQNERRCGEAGCRFIIFKRNLELWKMKEISH